MMVIEILWDVIRGEWQFPNNWAKRWFDKSDYTCFMYIHMCQHHPDDHISILNESLAQFHASCVIERDMYTTSYGWSNCKVIVMFESQADYLQTMLSEEVS